MDKTESVLWAVVAARPEDDAPKLVLAKWLDDRGDPRGACLRWIVAEKLRPAFDRHDTKTWDWWSRRPADPLHYEISPCEYLVPMNLFSRLAPFGPGLWKGEPTFLAALQNLCMAWRECAHDGAAPLAEDRPRQEPRSADCGLAAGSQADV